MACDASFVRAHGASHRCQVCVVKSRRSPPACIPRYGRRERNHRPYCSTLFRYDPGLDPHAARPTECALQDSGISSQASGAPGSAS